MLLKYNFVRKQKPPIRRFQTKIISVLLLSMTLVLLTSNLIICRISIDNQFNAIRQQLITIAQISAWQIDTDSLMAIPLRREGIHTQAYKKIFNQLRKLKGVSPNIRYMYIMVKTEQDGIWQFVADADTIPGCITPENLRFRGNATNPLSYPGDTYDATRFPEMLKSFDGPTADTKLTRDEWGTLLSGYAPIRDSKGLAVAVLGVDYMANDVETIMREYQKPVLIVFLGGLVLAFILGLFVARPVSRPIEELVEGTRRIAKGDLHFRAKIQGEDEIKELAESFNQMAESLSVSRRRLLGYFHGVVRSLIQVLEARDTYTKGHSETVANIAVKIAIRMDLPRDEIKVFKKMALLHDIGKVGICDRILNKATKLTDEEWQKIKEHPVLGESILKPVLKNERFLEVIRNHHERYDGNGYPDALKGEAISIYAAIAGVADAYHAMTSDRSYRKALTKEEAIAELQKNSGTQFNPKVVDILIEILKTENPH